MTSAKSELLFWGFKRGIFPAAAHSILTEAAASALANIQGELQWRRANLYNVDFLKVRMRGILVCQG